jgi:HlyD family secretion protein
MRLVWRLVDGKPRPTPIKVGVTDGTRSEVVSGDLAAGQAVITDVQGSGAAPPAMPFRRGF